MIKLETFIRQYAKHRINHFKKLSKEDPCIKNECRSAINRINKIILARETGFLTIDETMKMLCDINLFEISQFDN